MGEGAIWGQLTAKGQDQLFTLGNFTRRRLLDENYTGIPESGMIPSLLSGREGGGQLVEVNSTRWTRTVRSARWFLAGFWPGEVLIILSDDPIAVFDRSHSDVSLYTAATALILPDPNHT